MGDDLDDYQTATTPVYPAQEHGLDGYERTNPDSVPDADEQVPDLGVPDPIDEEDLDG